MVASLVTPYGRISLIQQMSEGRQNLSYRGIYESGRSCFVKIARPSDDPAQDTTLPLRIEHTALDLLVPRSHRNIIAEHEFYDEECTALVLDYLPGVTLESLRRKSHRLDLSLMQLVVPGVCDALTDAHPAGIVHRDVKGANIMVDLENTVNPVHLVDFSLARVDSLRYPSESDPLGYVGPAAYLAPETLTERHYGPSTDTYALGVTVYRSLAGVPPVTGVSAIQVAKNHLRPHRPDIRNYAPELPDSVATVVNRAIRMSRKDRFANPAEFKEAFMSAIPTGSVFSRAIKIAKEWYNQWRCKSNSKN